MGEVSTRDPDEFSARQWPDWSFWADRRRGRVVSLIVNGSATLLLGARIDRTAGGHGAPVTGIAVGLVVCYAAGYLLALWYGPMSSRRTRVAIVAVLLALGIAPAVLLGSPDALTDLTYAVVLGLMLLPLRFSVPLGLAAAGGQVVWMRLADGRVDAGQVATLLGVTAALGTVFALMFTIGHLRAARARIRSLAVARERERVARDLHDVLGHSLSTMTVRTGLARRVLETSGDVDRAVAELRDLEQLSRQALSDVRATVSDYRTVSLAAEIAGARAALRAAGVRAELPSAADEVAPELQTVFGHVVRESVTNVLRHSDAGRCTVRLGRDWVEVADDGKVPDGVEPGHGLTGLAERLAAVGGGLEYGRGPDGGFRVCARGPRTGRPAPGALSPAPSASGPSSPDGEPAARPEGGAV